MPDRRRLVTTSTRAGELEAPANKDQTLMVAALAAVLVEYRRCSENRRPDNRSQDGGEQWRVVGRIEQLRRSV